MNRAEEIFRIYKSDTCYLIIEKHSKNRRSLEITGSWAGVVLQFTNDESVNEILEVSREWLIKRIKKGFDTQFSSKKDFEYLFMKIDQSKQLELNL